ncbi:hypothetical protein HDG34_003180 [Paraburkholderia sp. HC6.4b]|uniref:Rz1-like lysis system protein LysC n=1 Tax=unclassified Paraburkholderia TaxID=2615204 RepID=UPI00161AE3D3|nr:MULTISPECIES: hypothetical protein [unclassified Paraburkholderia]MBB5409239.1 hypothetical protein [Paraburkholderia sp. HC6.4b]MBB5450967.1 hypothetical protein [Paraburkholderia sp. Kb1A]
MKRFNALAATGLTALCVAGCSTTPAVVNHYQTILPEIPAILLADCPVAPPPDRTQYLSSDWEGKEDLLSQVYIAQTTNLANCNIDKKNLRTWWAQTKAAVDKANAAAAPTGTDAPGGGAPQ